MIRYITRHGQVTYPCNEVHDHMLPPGDETLSPLGRKQATLLGRRMKKAGFQGKIISSPYIRCMETAELIAKETGALILPYAPIREIMRNEETAKEFKGLTLEQMRERFSYIDPEAQLDYPWWKDKDSLFEVEKPADVRARVAQGVKELEEKYPDTELLFVGHGASSGALLRYYQIPVWPNFRRTMLFNCSFSMIDPNNAEVKPVYCDTSHLLYEETTSNFLTQEEYDQMGFEEEWNDTFEVPEEIQNIKGLKVLHIGDTYSNFYPFFRKLIATVKPDVIIHTGDLADEVKVGRIPTVRYEYNSKIRRIIDVMDQSGARLIIVPGNNDVFEEVEMLCPRAEVLPEDSIITIEGVECRVGHQVNHITYDKDWSFYGHGLSCETWKYEYNVEGQPCRFNVSWGSFVYSISEKKFFFIENPREF